MDALEALKLAYRKHCMGDDTIGWGEVEVALLNALCNEMGDKEFNEWCESVKGAYKPKRAKSIAEIIKQSYKAREER